MLGLLQTRGKVTSLRVEHAAITGDGAIDVVLSDRQPKFAGRHQRSAMKALIAYRCIVIVILEHVHVRFPTFRLRSIGKRGRIKNAVDLVLADEVKRSTDEFRIRLAAGTFC